MVSGQRTERNRTKYTALLVIAVATLGLLTYQKHGQVQPYIGSAVTSAWKLVIGTANPELGRWEERVEKAKTATEMPENRHEAGQL